MKKLRLILVLGLVLVVFMSSYANAIQKIDTILWMKSYSTTSSPDDLIRNVISERDSTNLLIQDIDFQEYLTNTSSSVIIYGSVNPTPITLTIDGKEYISPQYELTIGHPIFCGKTIEDVKNLCSISSDIILFASDNSSFVGNILIHFQPSTGQNYTLVHGVIIEDSDEGLSSDERLTALESWKETISTTVDAIETQLESVKQWLFFWSYQGEGQDVCDAIKSNCSIQPKVIFRTNATNGNYNASTWIVYDFNGDGRLEARKGATSITTKTGACPACVVTDYYGKCLIKYGTTYYYIKEADGASCKARAYSYSTTGAELSAIPKEPYTSNHQEVFEGGKPS